MKTELYLAPNKHWVRGQSLVEIALVLPIMVIIIAGVVEVSNLLITKNRVETAARASARYAAAGGQSVEVIVLNTVTQTLDLSEGVWDIFFIKALVNSGGDDFAEWEFSHLYGISNTTAFTEVLTSLSPECETDCIRDQVLYDLQTDETGAHIDPVPGEPSTQIAADLQVVGVVIIHDIDSILGLNSFPALSDVTSVEGLGIMRLSGIADADETAGCDTAFPIVLSHGPRSLTQTLYDAMIPEFIFPDTPPVYGSFTGNRPDEQLSAAQEGYIFQFRPDDGATSTMAWLRWNDTVGEDGASLATSLDWPGNVFDPTDGFIDVRDNLDRELHVDDAVAHSNTAAALTNSSVQGVLNEQISLGRVLRVLVIDETVANPEILPPAAPHFTPDQFATVRLHGYGANWLLVEFINWDSSCGQS